MAERYVSAQEGADQILGGAVTADWLRTEWREGRLPGLKFGHRTIRFAVSDLEALRERARQGPAKTRAAS